MHPRLSDAIRGFSSSASSEPQPHPNTRNRGRLFEGGLILTGDLLAIAIATTRGARWSVTAVILALMMLLSLAWSSEYSRPRVTLSAMSDLPRLAPRAVIPLMVVALDAAVQQVERWAFVYVAMMAAFVCLGRFLTYAILRQLRRIGWIQQACLIIGAGNVGAELAMLLAHHPELGLVPVDVYDDNDPRGHGVRALNWPQVVPAAVEHTGASRVIFAFGPSRDEDIIDVVRRSEVTNVEFYVVPRLFELGAAAGDPLADEVWGIPLVWLRRTSVRDFNLRAKRFFDLAISGLMILLLSPIIAFVAMAVRTTSRGPVLFRQRRVGMGGREFDVLKFRSMPVNNDSDTTWSVERDRRLTRIGAFLRRTSLDELPQLFNVLKGDMSLVGPRPERPHFVAKFTEDVPGYTDRHRIPVGLTGWAQIHGLRGDTSIAHRVRFDNMYIEHWSLWRDLTILSRTLGAVIRGTRVTSRATADDDDDADACYPEVAQSPVRSHK